MTNCSFWICGVITSVLIVLKVDEIAVEKISISFSVQSDRETTSFLNSLVWSKSFVEIALFVLNRICVAFIGQSEGKVKTDAGNVASFNLFELFF